MEIRFLRWFFNFSSLHIVPLKLKSYELKRQVICPPYFFDQYWTSKMWKLYKAKRNWWCVEIKQSKQLEKELICPSPLSFLLKNLYLEISISCFYILDLVKNTPTFIETGIESFHRNHRRHNSPKIKLEKFLYYHNFLHENLKFKALEPRFLPHKDCKLWLSGILLHISIYAAPFKPFQSLHRNSYLYCTPALFI